MVNALTRHTGFTLGPIVLETLVKHYFERVANENAEHAHSTRLRKEELLYDEAFNIIKSFMQASTKHTVEELQAFSNMRTPSPPWVHVVRVMVPMSTCDDAATHLIAALGGEEMTKRIVGGTKWWQVRGVKGIDGEWIVAKKDWQEVKKKQKARGVSVDGGIPAGPSTEYKPEMDQMRCILYAHGGGYYFGSVDQERYSIQRFARKVNGRVFAINYRLAPQYPFPCAIQDFLAAYLYLIRPPPGALHTAVSPANIVFGGDSAGGGLCIALLQVLRDAHLPLPAGAFLISPWCDLTHSFPSIHLNTATDIIPTTGLSLYKPSTLWPPPPDELTTRVHQGLRRRIRDALRPHPHPHSRAASPSSAPPGTPDISVQEPHTGRTLHLGSAVSLREPTQSLLSGARAQRVSMTTAAGEELAIDDQIHMYAPNYLLMHPLVSPVAGYLGGLPPLLVIASDKEVLRDEVIYFAHKAAHPDQYPIKADARAMYPALDGIEKRYGPTKVHLQVYDDCAHTLPILFTFTTPAKFCFRAIATFIKYTTGMLPKTLEESIDEQQEQQEESKPASSEDVLNTGVTTTSPASTQLDLLNGVSAEAKDEAGPSQLLSPSEPSADKAGSVHTAHSDSAPREHAAQADNDKKPTSPPTSPRRVPSTTSAPPTPTGSTFAASASGAGGTDSVKRRASMKPAAVRRALSASVSRASTFLRRQDAPAPPLPQAQGSDASDVGGPRFGRASSGEQTQPQVRHAGEAAVYASGLDTMIRERISTRGVVRALEPEADLTAFRLPRELVCDISELALRRYVDGAARLARKFGKAAKAIEKERARNLERARAEDAALDAGRLRSVFSASAADAQEGAGVGDAAGVSSSSSSAGSSWAWAWALDEDEHPPPSSIVSRRDTEEARRLARIADQAVFADGSTVNANSLWSLIVNFLTTTPERGDAAHKHKHKHGHGHEHHEHEENEKPANTNGNGNLQSPQAASAKEKSETLTRRERMVSRFAWLTMENRKSHGVNTTSPKISQKA